MAEYSRIAKGRFTSTGGAQIVQLPFQPDYVEFVNYTAATTPAHHGVPFAKWDANMGQGFAVEQVFNVTPVLTSDIVIERIEELIEEIDDLATTISQVEELELIKDDKIWLKKYYKNLNKYITSIVIDIKAFNMELEVRFDDDDEDDD